jgi:acyl carrier protein
MADVAQTVKSYILEEFLPGENPDELKPDTPLITGGILDSVATLKLVAFLEDQFKITVEAHEVDVENLNTIADIGRLVAAKSKG